MLYKISSDVWILINKNLTLEHFFQIEKVVNSVYNSDVKSIGRDICFLGKGNLYFTGYIMFIIFRQTVDSYIYIPKFSLF